MAAAVSARNWQLLYAYFLLVNFAVLVTFV